MPRPVLMFILLATFLSGSAPHAGSRPAARGEHAVIGMAAAADESAPRGPTADTAHPPPEPPAPAPSPAIRDLLERAVRSAQAADATAALEAIDRALAATRGVGDAAGEAAAQEFLARVLERLARTEEAVAAWRAAAAAWQRAGDGPGQVGALAQAGLLLEPADPAEAGRLFGQAVALARGETKRPRAAALALDVAAQASYDQRLLGPARQLWSEALAIYSRLAPDSLEVALFLNCLGTIAFNQGDPAAKEYLQRSLVLGQKQAPGSLAVAMSLMNLGNIARYEGNLVAAREYFEQALAIQEKQAPNSLDLSGSLNNLAAIAYTQGDLALAKVYLQRVLAIREQQEPDSLDVAMGLNNLAITVMPHDLPGAEADLQQALEIAARRAPGSLEVAQILNNLGMDALLRRDPAQAQAYHRRALAIREKLSPGSLEVAVSLSNLGLAAYNQGDLPEAKQRFQQALDIDEKLAPGSLDMARVQSNLGLVARAEKNWPEAERWCRRAWDLVRSQAAAVAGDEARQAFGSSTALYPAELARAQIARREFSAAFATLEEGRAQALQRLLAERQSLLRAAGGKLWDEQRVVLADLHRAEQLFQRAAARYEVAQGASSTGSTAATDLEARRRQLDQARSDYLRARRRSEQLWAGIQKSEPRAFAPPLTLEQARRALPSGFLFVAFSVGEKQTDVFFLRGGGTAGASAKQDALSVYTIPVTLSDLQALVDRLRRGVTNPAVEVSEVSQAGRALFETLFPAKARPALLGAKRLLISPDGPLWEAPFAALVTNAQGPPHYLGTEKPLTYTQSLTLFAQTRRERPRRAAGRPPVALVVGYPAAGSTTPRGELALLLGGAAPPAPLPGMRREAERIARLYRSQPLTGEKATEATVRRQVEQADVAHFATHGLLHPVLAMSSGILLALPRREPSVGDTKNDGVLQAWEIFSQLKLHAELVVLSACDSGQGRNVPGEGLVGLTRALQYAGARSVVASQWRVEDESAPALMLAFHEGLRRGLAKDEALRQAMAGIRKNPRTAHPYYWAPFVLTGDPDTPRWLAASPKAPVASASAR